jgi:SAM-dependent methyltransferase
MIHQNYLIGNGWQKEGSTYTKGSDIITYDGCWWFFNGNRIFDDYSEYLKQPGMLDYIEQEWLNNPAGHYFHSGIINSAVKQFKIKSVLEVGCGTGNVAKRLISCEYTGIDANEECVRLAKEKNPDKKFYTSDIRVTDRANSDLVFCFGVLKHFGLHEWSEVFKRIASFGTYFIFDMPICGEVKDDGTEHHHVWGTLVWITEQCSLAGVKVIETAEINKDEYYFITKRV